MNPTMHAPNLSVHRHDDPLLLLCEANKSCKRLQCMRAGRGIYAARLPQPTHNLMHTWHRCNCKEKKNESCNDVTTQRRKDAKT